MELPDLPEGYYKKIKEGITALHIFVAETLGFDPEAEDQVITLGELVEWIVIARCWAQLMEQHLDEAASIDKETLH